MKFPDYFPDGCPPKEATKEEIMAYRMCKSNTIVRSDFLSFFELGKNIHNNINGYGVSVLSDFKEAQQIAKMPAHKKEYMATGITKAECGVILRTKSQKYSSHITWWLYEGATPEMYFK